MKALTKKEYQILLDLIEKEKYGLEKDIATSEKVKETYHALNLISVKLYTQQLLNN